VRLGKWLLLAFDGDVGLLSHLGMTGKWVRTRAGAPEPKYVRLALELPGGDAVFYTDPRMFGRIQVLPASKLRDAVSSLGPDPLVDGIDVAALHERLSRTGRPIKVVLLDQTVLAGIGNIYAAEALWRAKLDPARPARALDRSEVSRLARGIRAALEDSLEKMGRGDSITYVEEGGENWFKVYGRAGEPCPRCGATLAKRTQAARTTTFCPVCQAPGTRKGAARRRRPSEKRKRR
jgi:formamidopyrimidine-DNA glycosylase